MDNPYDIIRKMAFTPRIETVWDIEPYLQATDLSSGILDSEVLLERLSIRNHRLFRSCVECQIVDRILQEYWENNQAKAFGHETCISLIRFARQENKPHIALELLKSKPALPDPSLLLNGLGIEYIKETADEYLRQMTPFLSEWDVLLTQPHIDDENCCIKSANGFVIDTVERVSKFYQALTASREEGAVSYLTMSAHMRRDVPVLTLKGELSHKTLGANLDKSLAESLGQAPWYLVLDLTQLTYCNAEGLTDLFTQLQGVELYIAAQPEVKDRIAWLSIPVKGGIFDSSELAIQTVEGEAEKPLFMQHGLLHDQVLRFPRCSLNLDGLIDDDETVPQPDDSSTMNVHNEVESEELPALETSSIDKTDPIDTPQKEKTQKSGQLKEVEKISADSKPQSDLLTLEQTAERLNITTGEVIELVRHHRLKQASWQRHLSFREYDIQAYENRELGEEAAPELPCEEEQAQEPLTAGWLKSQENAWAKKRPLVIPERPLLDCQAVGASVIVPEVGEDTELSRIHESILLLRVGDNQCLPSEAAPEIILRQNNEVLVVNLEKAISLNWGTTMSVWQMCGGQGVVYCCVPQESMRFFTMLGADAILPFCDTEEEAIVTANEIVTLAKKAVGPSNSDTEPQAKPQRTQLESSAQKGDVDAMSYLGHILIDQKNLYDGVLWLEKAAIHDDKDAQSTLRHLCSTADYPRPESPTDETQRAWNTLKTAIDDAFQRCEKPDAKALLDILDSIDPVRHQLYPLVECAMIFRDRERFQLLAAIRDHGELAAYNRQRHAGFGKDVRGILITHDELMIRSWVTISNWLDRSDCPRDYAVEMCKGIAAALEIPLPDSIM